ncbi:MAG TPA: hypothetical protein DCY93_00990 [Firmicutes bacterium]|nr:hypothetical protein [Bacillota bacterium]
MKKFRVIEGGNYDVKDLYCGEYIAASNLYVFKEEKGKQSIEIRKTDSFVELVRHGKDIDINAKLIENRVCKLHVKLLTNNYEGDFPILVRKIHIDYPREINIVYHMLDDKNYPADLIDILISENV